MRILKQWISSTRWLRRSRRTRTHLRLPAQPRTGEHGGRLEERVATLENHLSEAPFADVNSRFLRLRGKGKLDPKWHWVAGERTIRGIAESTGRLPQYGVFYSINSGAAHASAYRNHVLTPRRGKAVLLPIRSLKGLTETIRVDLSSAMGTYRQLLSAHRPEELPAFGRLYEAEWKERFMGLPTVEVDFGSQQRG